jgi:hypothetical protein
LKIVLLNHLHGNVGIENKPVYLKLPQENIKKIKLKTLDRDIISFGKREAPVAPQNLKYLEDLAEFLNIKFFDTPQAETFINPEEIPVFVEKLTDSLLKLKPSDINVKSVQDIINRLTTTEMVKVKDLSELKREGLEDAFALYESPIKGDKALYIDFKVDMNDLKTKARAIEAIVHEFTHALQDNTNTPLARLNPVVIQRGMLQAFRSKFFEAESTLFKFFTNTKYFTKREKIDLPSEKELLKYFNASRKAMDDSYKDVLLSSLVSRKCSDRKLATEYFIQEARAESQAYKLGNAARKKVLNEGDYYNYDMFYQLLEDFANYLERRGSFKPVFVSESHPAYDKLENVSVDLELAFGKDTIMAYFQELEKPEALKLPAGQSLNLFDLFKNFDRKSLNIYYQQAFDNTLATYNLKPDKKLLNDLGQKALHNAGLVNTHLEKIKREYQSEDIIFNADYIPLIYQDFASYLVGLTK